MMPFSFAGFRMIAPTLVAVAAIQGYSLPITLAQNKLVEPVYRVANETSAAQPAATAASQAPAAQPIATGKVVLEFTAQNGEHPLAPVIRVCKASLEEIDRKYPDYSCTLIKRERIDDELGEPQHIFIKVRHEPFSVYMSFLQPYQGREVLWVAGQNNNEMVVREAGVKRLLGKMNLDPEGAVAMSGQKYPVTRVGFRNLTAELIRRFDEDSKYSECQVTPKPDMKIGGRPAIMVQIMHPVPRRNFKWHVARLFFDNELGIIVHYDAYLWPEQPGGQPPLDESFTYTNLKLNNGYTARDFDANNNPDIFKP